MSTEPEEPRAYTEAEVRDMVLEEIHAVVQLWAALPDKCPRTGRVYTIQDRCDGVAFSILARLDGCGMTLPAITLKLDPHPDDKAFCKAEGLNWFEPGMEVSDMLHEHYAMLHEEKT